MRIAAQGIGVGRPVGAECPDDAFGHSSAETLNQRIEHRRTVSGGSNPQLAIVATAAIVPRRWDGWLTRWGLPLAALSAAQAHHAMLARLGCRHLGDLRRLPRPALAKRFGPALLTALDIPALEAWDGASEDQRIAALIDARERIVQLNFNLLNSNVNFGQDSLQYVPEGQYQSSYVARNSLFIFHGNLAILTPQQFTTLPERFKTALRKAQVAEADRILGGDPYDEKRQSGLVMEQVGESRQMFRAGKALTLPVCRRALGYLSYYVTFNKRIGRSG